MPFSPDIIATSPDSAEILLVVEAKASMVLSDDVETQLKQYMFGTNCPVGMIISPDWISIYKNDYRESSKTSISRVGKWPNDITEFRMLKRSLRSGHEFESLTQSWLSDLAANREIHSPSADLRDALATYVLPALSVAMVRAGGPRIEQVRPS